MTVSMKQHLPAVFVATRVDISDETSRQFEAKKKKSILNRRRHNFNLCMFINMGRIAVTLHVYDGKQGI